MRQTARIQQEVRDPEEFIQTSRWSCIREEVYTFTPKGLVEGAARGATAIDFAYSIHTDVGHPVRRRARQARWCRCARASRNGDIVEISRRRPPAQPRLAEFRLDARARNQDQAPDSFGEKAARRRARTQAVREGSAPDI